jgi:MFS family permease
MRFPSPYDRLVLPVYLPSLLMAVSLEAMTILLPLYILDLGQSAAFAVLIAGLRGVGVLLFDVPAGMLVARFGDKPVLLGGLGLILFGMLMLTFATDPRLLGLAAPRASTTIWGSRTSREGSSISRRRSTARPCDSTPTCRLLASTLATSKPRTSAGAAPSVSTAARFATPRRTTTP